MKNMLTLLGKKNGLNFVGHSSTLNRRIDIQKMYSYEYLISKMI